MSSTLEPTLEPATPPHLTCPRTQPSSLPPNYQPPFPAYCARFPESMKTLTMAVIGFQYPASIHKSDSDTSRNKLLGFLQSPQQDIRPVYHELATYTDPAFYRNEVAFAYWAITSAYSAWADKSGFAAFWGGLNPKQGGGKGWFLEIFSPSMDRFEMVFSNDTVPEGAAHMRARVSGPMREHVCTMNFLVIDCS